MMEETANPTPSATLAPEMPTTAVGEPKANTTSIKLLIKASNQQHDDQIIESDLMWTVYRLKTQLSLVYPSKPPVSEQKLIYSGQLLNDCTQLKDVIRSYKDVYTQHHIFHLVYTPKNQTLPSKNSTKMTPVNNTTDGLRQRHSVATTSNSNSSSNNNLNTNAPTVNGTQQTNRQQIPASTYSFLAPGLQRTTATGGISGAFSVNTATTSSSTPFTAGFDMQSLAIQQAAMYNWMWQTYGQYMQQIQAFSSAAQMPTTDSTNNTTHSTNPFNPVIAFPSLTPAAFFAQPYLNQPNQIPISNIATQGQQGEPLQEQQQQEQQEAEAAPPQPRFLNIVQEEQENRDWLDSIFSIMRLALVLTVLYFNSSAIRCFVVFLIAGGIYLYHIGFFRLRQERNNNNINRNNNAAAEPAQQDGQQHNEAENDTNLPQNEQINESAALASGTSTDSTNTNDVASIAAQDAAAVDNNSTSVIAFMRSFIVSFFTSLLPETPAAL